MTVKQYNGYTEVSGVTDLSLRQTFNCGQCFRFDEDGDGYSGVAFGRYVRFMQPSPDILRIYCPRGDDAELWMRFLSLDVDYGAIKRDIAGHFGSGVMDEAIKYGGGIRILRQQPWEAVCSFIVSQNNNISRIKKIIAGLCRTCGEPADGADSTYYSFPTAEALYKKGVDGIFALKTGFRAKYIYDAASRVTDGRLDFDALVHSDTKTLVNGLRGVKGIGPKVASCAALFGFGRTEAFPVDVWIRRSLDRHFGGELDINSLGEYAGIAQQYLFYYERDNGGKVLSRQNSAS